LEKVVTHEVEGASDGASDQGSRTETAQRETPHVGIIWLVQTSNGEAKLLTAGCLLDQAEPYGDCLTYSPGHYKTWAQWRRDRTLDPALRDDVNG
jgi:hypothetical protein